MIISGEVTGTGTYTLNSDVVRGNFTNIKIPHNHIAIIDDLRISCDAAAQLYLRFSHNISVSPPTIHLNVRFDLPSTGIYDSEKKIILEGLSDSGFYFEKTSGTGTAAISFTLKFVRKVRIKYE